MWGGVICCGPAKLQLLLRGRGVGGCTLLRSLKGHHLQSNERGMLVTHRCMHIAVCMLVITNYEIMLHTLGC